MDQKENQQNKPQYKLVGNPVEVEGKNGNVLIVSRQDVIQPSGQSSQSIVIKKIRRSIDGSQQGRTTQVFVPVGLLSDLIESLQSFENGSDDSQEDSEE